MVRQAHYDTERVDGSSKLTMTPRESWFDKLTMTPRESSFDKLTMTPRERRCDELTMTPRASWFDKLTMTLRRRTTSGEAERGSWATASAWCSAEVGAVEHEQPDLRVAHRDLRYRERELHRLTVGVVTTCCSCAMSLFVSRFIRAGSFVVQLQHEPAPDVLRFGQRVGLRSTSVEHEVGVALQPRCRTSGIRLEQRIRGWSCRGRLRAAARLCIVICRPAAETVWRMSLAIVAVFVGRSGRRRRRRASALGVAVGRAARRR